MSNDLNETYPETLQALADAVAALEKAKTYRDPGAMIDAALAQIAGRLGGGE